MIIILFNIIGFFVNHYTGCQDLYFTHVFLPKSLSRLYVLFTRLPIVLIAVFVIFTFQYLILIFSLFLLKFHYKWKTPNPL